jgi:serine/threonine protein kinase
MMNESEKEEYKRWQRVEEIYHTALSLASTERQIFVAQTCAEDADLQAEVVSLLAADEDMSDFLREPVVELGLMVLASEGTGDTESPSLPTQPVPANLTGAKIGGRYEVIKRLGGGGFGDVYKAVDTKLMSRPVAIKVLKDDVLRAEKAQRDWVVIKFQQEIEALSKIHDPGVAGIFDADTLPDGRPYIVMEFVEGSDLRSILKQAKQEQVAEQCLQFQDMAEIIKQVGRTLTATHEAEIFHRDLKPENIMLRRNTDGDLQIKIIDFGIAKVRNSLIASSAATDLFIAGTKSYMSPEQLLGKRVEAASDIYALGVIAYEMVTGRCPFTAKDSAHLKDLQAAGVKVKPCDLNPDLSVAAQEAILKALSYYPAERYKRARDFGDGLARALVEDEKLARPFVPVPVSPEIQTLRKPNAAAETRDGKSIGVQPQVTQAKTSWPRLLRRWLFTIAAILLAGLAGFLVWHALTKPERTLTYWLSMQRPRDAKPFDSIGEKVFDSGSQFWFNVQTTQAGALYLFGEGHNKNGPSELKTMFPTPISGNGNARLEANTNGSVNQTPYEFENDSGVIYLWIIWSAEPVSLLDEIVRTSYGTGGTISDPRQRAALGEFIEQHKAPESGVVIDDIRFRVTLKGRSDILVDRRKLEYQP